MITTNIALKQNQTCESRTRNLTRVLLRAKIEILEIHAFSAHRILDGKQSGVNESSLDDRKIYGRDGWAERASVV